MKRAACGLWLGLLLALGAGCSRDEPPASRASAGGEAAAVAGRPAPAFSLPRLGGGTVSLDALRGRYALIDFWATWCAPCELNVPEFNAFLDAHRDDPAVAVLAVATEAGADVEQDVARWVAEKGVRYPVALGSLDLAERYGAPGLPATFLVSPEGRIVDEHLGFIDREALEQMLARARAGHRAGAQAARAPDRSGDGGAPEARTRAPGPLRGDVRAGSEPDTAAGAADVRTPLRRG